MLLPQSLQDLLQRLYLYPLAVGWDSNKVKAVVRKDMDRQVVGRSLDQDDVAGNRQQSGEQIERLRVACTDDDAVRSWRTPIDFAQPITQPGDQRAGAAGGSVREGIASIVVENATGGLTQALDRQQLRIRMAPG